MSESHFPVWKSRAAVLAAAISSILPIFQATAAPLALNPGFSIGSGPNYSISGIALGAGGPLWIAGDPGQAS